MHLMYSNTVFKWPLEVKCIRVTLVSRVKENLHAEEVHVQVKFSGLPCKIGHHSTAILKTFGDFSLVCGLQFV